MSIVFAADSNAEEEKPSKINMENLNVFLLHDRPVEGSFCFRMI